LLNASISLFARVIVRNLPILQPRCSGILIKLRRRASRKKCSE